MASREDGPPPESDRPTGRERFDVLDAREGRDAPRLAAFRDALVADADDPVLQAIVQQASRELAAPIAMVSLVLRRTQFFRAQVGLPEDLALARGTGRDVSFCQLVVRDGVTVEIEDAATDVRVPQALVLSHNVRSYLGSPLRVDGHVLGTLCVLDVVPRGFSADDRGRLEALAQQASDRLAEMPSPAAVVGRELLAHASAPAFAELRNLLTPLLSDAAMCEVALADLAPLVRIARGGVADDPAAANAVLLARAAEAFADLRGTASTVRASVDAVIRSVIALEHTLIRAGDRVALAAAMTDADVLAHHHTKLVGGVRWAPVSPSLYTLGGRTSVTAVLAWVLSAIATRMIDARLSGGLAGAVHEQGDDVAVRVTSALDPVAIAAVRDEVSQGLGGDGVMELRAAGDGFDVVLRRA